ncbi:MAG: AraC family transcriptional regulator [Capsulimonadaceae bacterium]|nr:AraC family transcriptional regulator [Capsulimonadaceae bacterium]
MLQEINMPSYTNMTYVTDVPSLPGAQPPRLWLATMGRFISAGGFVFEQIAANAAVHIVESGSGTMRANGVDYEVGRGDVFTFFPQSHYRYWDAPQAPWRYTWCLLAGKDAVAALQLAGITPEKPLVRGDYATLIEPLFTEAARILRAPRTPPAFAISFAWRLVDAIEQARERPEPPGERNIVETAKSLLDGHFSSNLGVGDLARQLGVSRATLFRKFKEAYGTSPKEYLDNIRIGRAQRLLQESPAPIREIAAACGYDDPHYFIGVYKRATGRTPGQDRAGG